MRLIFVLLLLFLSGMPMTIGSGSATLKTDDQAGEGEGAPCSDPTVACARLWKPG